MWTKNIDAKLAGDIAERIDIVARQNESLNLRITLFDPTTGSPLDLTDYTMTFIVQKDTTNVVTLNEGTGITIVTPTSGVMDITIPVASTTFPASTYTYNLIATNGSYVKSWLAGLYHQKKQTDVANTFDKLNQSKIYVRILDKDILLTITNNN